MLVLRGRNTARPVGAMAKRLASGPRAGMHGTYSMKAGDMEAAYDVLGVGGGRTGLSAALSLARYDRRVMLFDAGRAFVTRRRSS